MALKIRDAARNSIGSRMFAKSLELKHTIRLIRELDTRDWRSNSIHFGWTPFSYYHHSWNGLHMAVMILAAVGDFTRFDFPGKLLAYAGMSLFTYQFGQLKNCYQHMEKCFSRYLCVMLFTMQPSMSATGIQPLPLSCKETDNWRWFRCDKGNF